jgi:hypothetical protein
MLPLMESAQRQTDRVKLNERVCLEVFETNKLKGG